MGFREAATAAIRPFVQRPVRTLLLLQGTIWAVAVAVFPSAVIEGTRHAVLERGAGLGADRVSLAADPTALGGSSLTRDDVALVQEALAAAGIPVHAAAGARVRQLFGPSGERGALVEAGPGGPEARGLALAEGRWLHPDDDAAACVVEAGVGSRVGDSIQVEIDGESPRALRVVGVTCEQDPRRLRTNDLGFAVDHPLYDEVARGLLYALGIPYVEDAWKRSDGVIWTLPRSEVIDWIFFRASPPDVKEAAGVASKALVSRGRSPLALRPLVLPLVVGEAIDRFDAVRVALFLSCLVMGAVVMANLGLLAALRRRREIAIRRVEGATRLRIALQFLVEGLVLTGIGCVLGCGLGMLLAALRVALSPVTGFAWRFPWGDGMVAVAVALLVGLLVSLLPAIRASRQVPVAGLAEE